MPTRLPDEMVECFRAAQPHNMRLYRDRLRGHNRPHRQLWRRRANQQIFSFG
jgi:hypothetical protein